MPLQSTNNTGSSTYLLLSGFLICQNSIHYWRLVRLFCLSCRLQICGGNQKLYPDQFMSAASTLSNIYIKIANSRTHAFVSLPLPKPQINIKSDLCNVCFLRSFKDTCTFSSWVCLPAGCHATINHKYSTQPRCFPGFSVRLFKKIRSTRYMGVFLFFYGHP